MDEIIRLKQANETRRIDVFDMADRGKNGFIVRWRNPRTGKQYGTTTADPDIIEALRRVLRSIAADEGR